MHYWGDEWFKENGEEFSKAIHWCMDNWKRWGRIGSHGKEKFGTFRHHPCFYSGWWPIHELFKPGYVAYWWPKWFYKIEINILQPIVKYSLFPWIMRKWQHYVYNAVVQRALKKWPQFFDELIEDSEFELLKPGIWGPVDGPKIKGEYWVTVTDEYIKERQEALGIIEYEGTQPPIPSRETLDAEDLLELYQEAWDDVKDSAWEYLTQEQALKCWEQCKLMIDLEEGEYEDWETSWDTIILPKGASPKRGSEGDS